MLLSLTMNWMKFRPLYFLISGIALAISLYAIFTWGFRYSIDFTGGAVSELRLENAIEPQLFETVLNLKKATDESFKKYDIKSINKISDKSLVIRFGQYKQENNSQDITQEDIEFLLISLSPELGSKPELVRFEVVGPALSKEILQKTYVAVAIASVGILFWIAYQFKSIQFGVSAILAMLHDTIILLGTFSLLGHFEQVELDILFVTAVLTILSFSVHDTIVVYDRIRETVRKNPGMHFTDIANLAITSTIVRSLNNSLTIIFMLLALFLLGGTSIKWFVFALLIGTISGTYSSPFVAVPLLVTLNNIKNLKIKFAKE